MSNAERLDGTVTKLSILKDEADMLGIKYPNNITATALEERITEFKEKLKEDQDSKDNAPIESSYSPSEVGRVKAIAHRMIRFKLVVNDPSLQQESAVRITAGNDVVGHVSRVIPFRAEAWHAEAIVVEHLKRMKFQQFKTKNRNGMQYMDSQDSTLLPSFTIIELPPLTEEELKDLAHLQAQQGTGISED